MERLATELARQSISYQLIDLNKIDLVFHNKICLDFQNNIRNFRVTIEVEKSFNKLAITYRIVAYDGVKLYNNKRFSDPKLLAEWYSNYIKKKQKIHHIMDDNVQDDEDMYDD